MSDTHNAARMLCKELKTAITGLTSSLVGKSASKPKLLARRKHLKNLISAANNLSAVLAAEILETSFLHPWIGDKQPASREQAIEKALLERALEPRENAIA